MYPLAVLLAIPFGVLTSGVTLWGAWQFAQIYSRASDSLLWGLDVHGLWVSGLGVCVVLWKFHAPVCAIKIWPTQRSSAVAHAFIWLGVVIASTIFVVPAVAIQYLGVTSLTDTRLLFLVAWPVLDTIASLLPAALMTPAAWRRARTTDTSDTSGAPAPVVIGALAHCSTSTSHGIKDSLLRFLQDVAQRPPGLVLEGVHITRERNIVTSQGTLARVRHVSKSTINRSLQALRAEGHIRFDASARETKITVMN